MKDYKNVILNEGAHSADVQVTNNNKRTVEFIAILQEADAKNRNRRSYPKKVLEEALKTEYVKERLDTNSFYGEAGHPFDTTPRRQTYIDQMRISHLIKEVWWEGNMLKGKIETADTDAGRNMKGLIEQGSKVAFSLRAQGGVKPDGMGGVVVQAPIRMITYDWVVNPSHKPAFMQELCESATNNYSISYFAEGADGDETVMYDEMNEAIHEDIYDNGRVIELSEDEFDMMTPDEADDKEKKDKENDESKKESKPKNDEDSEEDLEKKDAQNKMGLAKEATDKGNSEEERKEAKEKLKSMEESTDANGKPYADGEKSEEGEEFLAEKKETAGDSIKDRDSDIDPEEDEESEEDELTEEVSKKAHKYYKQAKKLNKKAKRNTDKSKNAMNKYNKQLRKDHKNDKTLKESAEMLVKEFLFEDHIKYGLLSLLVEDTAKEFEDSLSVLKEHIDAGDYKVTGEQFETRLFEEIDSLIENMSIEEIDYIPHRRRAVKKVSETYIYEAEHTRKIDTMNKIVTINEDHTIKKVDLDDYVTKDIRHTLSKILED